MFKALFRYTVNSMQKRYQYDVAYMHHIIDLDGMAFLKLMLFQPIYSHSANVPPGLIHAAKLRTVMRADCGECTELLARMALEQGLDPALIEQILTKDVAHLPEDIALVVNFTEHNLDKTIEADMYREQVLQTWGERGLIALCYSLASTQVYPLLKNALGYSHHCQDIMLNRTTIRPLR
ncbi:hypothetical protein [Alteromonas oceanisediminis]|uniref:hypothetical protein n=1 Tax=Alteromonas oceanisediminis TaxID=2836180 RepID=UPI001BD9B854|nr:hypothetical protein [Alteromonas oceanisediminis]MBT0588042.1 hypothetical protein [Alteromonas oceanisediminis]